MCIRDRSWVPHIEASKHDGGTAYVVFDDHRRGNWTPYIYRTENYGRDWDNLADESGIRGFVHTLEEDPFTPNLLFAGTEFGLYVSLNRGEDWFLWRHGLPPAPIRSLVIHPRDHDLVIGTHGRAIYIIDDIRPLRALAENPTLSSAPVHFFESPPAYLRSQAAVDGYHFAGDAMFRGQTKAPGATITYSTGPSVRAPTAAIEILGPDGQVIRSLEGPATPGIHRMVWDLRETNPFVEDAGSSFFRIQGLEVLPGSYEVRVRAGGNEASGLLEVLPDPRVEIPLEDRIQKRNAVKEMTALMATLQDVQDRLRAISQGLASVRAGLGTLQPPQAEEIRTFSDSLRTRASSIEEAVSQVEADRRSFYSMAATRDAPTEAERITLVRAGERLGRIVTRLNAFLSGQVGEFKRAVEASGLGGFPDVRTVQRRTSASGNPVP